jgi:hypothetical protein
MARLSRTKAHHRRLGDLAEHAQAPATPGKSEHVDLERVL